MSWYKEQFKKAAEKKKLTGSATSKNYKATITGLNYKLLQKQRQNPTKYKGNYSAFQQPLPRAGSFNQELVINSYTGDIVLTIQLPNSPEADGSYGYVNIVNVEKRERPAMKDTKPLTDRQIKNRFLRATEKLLSVYKSNSYYVNGETISEIELVADLVNELTLAYKEEIR